MSPKLRASSTPNTLFAGHPNTGGFPSLVKRSAKLGAGMIPIALMAAACSSEYDLVIIGSVGNTDLCVTSCDALVHDTYDNPAVWPPETEQLGHSVEILGYGYDEGETPTVNKNLRTVAAGAPYYFDSNNSVVAGRIKLINAATDTGNLLENKTVYTLSAPHTQIGELGFALLGADIRSGEVTNALVEVAESITSKTASYTGTTASALSVSESPLTAHEVNLASVDAAAKNVVRSPGGPAASYSMSSAPNPGSISTASSGAMGSKLNIPSDTNSPVDVGQVNQYKRYKGYGEELLAGAPASYNGKGAVVWYRHVGRSGMWEYGGEITAPSGTAGERFGAALAAPSTQSIRTPSDVAADHPAWIAVGAPGKNLVYIYIVVPGLANPLLYTQTVVGSTGTNAGFGTSLAMADYNLDGRMDLAVGAPWEGTGRVYVYLGQVGFQPLAATPYEVVPTGALAAGGEFGYSLAAGKFRRNDASRPALAVGVPDFNDGSVIDSGGLCQFQFTGASAFSMTTSWQRCDKSPDPGTNDRYGHALAVGNFRATNGTGGTGGDCAIGEEIAVGVPGKSNSGGSLAGSVKILGQDMDGGEPAEVGQILRGTRSGEQFGRALAADFAQQNVHEDLAIGSPLFDASRGSIGLTKAEPLGGSNDPISGTWRSTDSAGKDLDVYLVWNSVEATLSVDMITSATLEAKKNGATCKILGQDVKTTGKITFDPIPWTTTAVTHTERVDLTFSGYTVEVDVTYNAASNTFSLDIDESVFPLSLMDNDCSIVNEPFVFEKISGAVCD